MAGGDAADPVEEEGLDGEGEVEGPDGEGEAEGCPAKFLGKTRLKGVPDGPAL